MKVALLVARVSEPLAVLTTRSPTIPLPEKEATVSVALPSSFTLPCRSIFLPPAMVPMRCAEMSALAETSAPALSNFTSTVPLAVLGPTLMDPATVAATPVAGEARTVTVAPLTVTSPILAVVTPAVSDRAGTPFVDLSVPEKVAGVEVMPGIDSALEESRIDQLLRSARVPTNPMVEVVPEIRTTTLPRKVMPVAPISAESAWIERLSSTGAPAEISSPVMAAIFSDAAFPCSEGISSPSARTAPSRATRA